MKSGWLFLKRNIQWILLFFCMFFFLKIAEDVFSQELMRIDEIGYSLVSRYLISDFATPIAKFITQFGGSIFLVSFAIFLFLVLKNKKIGFCIWLNLVCVAVLNITMKAIFQRPRPEDLFLIEESGYSFPSGHSMVSAAFYGFLIYLIYHCVKNPYLKWALIVFLVFFIGLIGISRIYLGVHYTSDVLGGFFLSISYLIVYIRFTSRFVLPKQAS